MEVNVPKHGWTLHVTPDGYKYAYNHITETSTWDLPQVDAQLLMPGDYLYTVEIEVEQKPLKLLDYSSQEEEEEEESIQEKKTKVLEQLRHLNLNRLSSFITIRDKVDWGGLLEKDQQIMFTKYCELLEKPESKIIDVESEYTSLVKQNKKMMWEEFKQKYRKDARFYRYPATKREKMFRTLIKS